MIYDVEYLQGFSIADAIRYLKPSAKTVHIIISQQWVMLYTKEIPNGMNVYWGSAEHPGCVDYVESHINDPSALVFIDTATKYGKEICDKYKVCCLPKLTSVAKVEIKPLIVEHENIKEVHLH